MPYWSPTRFAALRRGLPVLVSMALHGCFFAQVKQRTSSYGPSPESVDLLGPRRGSIEAPRGSPGAFRIAVTGQGITVPGNDPTSARDSWSSLVGAPLVPSGRYVPAGSVKLLLAYEFNPYFEMGLIGGAACGKVVVEGEPRDISESCLPSFAMEMRGIFGSERLQFSVHLRLGVTAISAHGDFELATDDGDDVGTISEDVNVVLLSSTAFSLAWRITPRVVFITALTFDAAPFVRPIDTYDLDCDSLSDCKRSAADLQVSRTLAIVPALGVEVSLTESLRLRTLVTPVVFNGIDASPSYLGLSGSLEWGTPPRPLTAQASGGAR